MPDGGTYRILTVGPDINGFGGISALLRLYRQHIPGFRYASTNSRRGTLAGAFVLMWLLLRLPFFRLAGYDAIHAHGCSGKSFTRKSIVLAWARALGFRTIFHCHGGGFRDYVQAAGKDRVCRTLHRCDAVAVLTDGWKDYFEGSLDCKKVAVVPNIVAPLPESGFPTRDPSLESGFPTRDLRESDVVNLLFLGKICAEKGLWDIIDVLGANQDRYRGRVHLDIAGQGDVDQMNRRITDAGIGDMIAWHGVVMGQRKDDLLRRSHIMLLPSYIEGMPLTLLEAGVYAMPSIASNVGGIPELISDGVNGTLIEAGNKEQLARAIDGYLEQPSQIASQGTKAAQRVAGNLPDGVNSALARLYNML